LYPQLQQEKSIQQQRLVFRTHVERLDPSRLIFIDESGVHKGMSRLYGRAQGSQRVKGFTPFHPGQRTTLIAALGFRTFKAALFGSWYTDGSIFLTFIQSYLVPTLHPGDVVIMDNLSAHKRVGVKEAIERAGAYLLYLPPYSPDFSPIELAWSKIKSFLRKRAARTHRTLHRAICQAFQAITSHDILAWFQHCGYRAHSFG